MKVTIDNQDLILNIYELLRLLPNDHKIIAVDALSCQDEVIRNVVDQILDGWTEMGSHAGRMARVSATPYTALDEAARRIAKRSDEVAKKEIERLEEALLDREQEVNQLREKLDEVRNTPTYID